MFGTIKFSLTSTILIILVGCQQPPVVLEWKKYPQRVQTLTKTIIGERDFVSSNSKQAIQVDHSLQFTQQVDKPQNFKINLLDALSIHTCNMQKFVGEKNSSMGKVQTPANHFIYEASLLNQLNQCNYQKTKDAQALQQLHSFKRKQWSKQLDYFLLQAGIHKKLFQPSNTLLLADTQGIINLNAYFNAALKLFQLPNSNKPTAVIDEFNHRAAQLDGSMLMSQYFYTLEYTSASLNSVSHYLNQLNDNEVCDSARPIEIDYLENVLHGFFIKTLQPHLAFLSRLEHQIMPTVFKVFSHLQSPNAYAQRYLQNSKNNIFNVFNQANLNHQKAWNELLQNCKK
ncbi:hypothetical protein DS2_01205 [Catenovulum agarivorans DS-2]|uniref:Lipoprotein n=1 Tax=Catenovulum agarivorans DS-2 TaxID=1328313 RepID=W7QK55_9ALTE|nr:DUF3080 family protein [Catenovulum agarivorans]EWH12296.1 hypothetical protein DS2_01205 [Catenovulum agarivorans DS-2]